METNLESGDENRGRISNRSGRVMGGVILVAIGLIFMARQMGLDLPYWLFSWPVILIAVGFYIGGRHSFRIGGWVVPIIIGSVFLVEDVFYDIDMRHFLWPSIIIGIGLYMILRPRGASRRWDSGSISSEDVLDATSVFSGTKKNIISKDFKGGTITNMFGGTDLNLMQADINGTAIIDSTTIFGGTKLVIPAHWNLKSDVVCIFGGIDDKRQIGKESDSNKTLVLKGTCIFGGIDIKSH